ncbi:iron-siderophore ABC transporter substrate-binding protein [Dolichospermum sp. UHCC 0259]|uniref:iron-siderophore ABC transporter substrate-binding protein n=1 Tax=Dolichospermum sp. UHCC 0259 TaxID=2590010 RepID=UPI00144768D5|nr:iron-siderophore ABC transporter substrate-binding protein [Dolichospermum sp. UHCC 0259]MTJ50259.1 iron-siderophore ABC transporter substrate-binding protein [Dolichospermum sp. UHCC 0259]
MKKRHFAYLRLCILTAISLLIVTACYSGFYQKPEEIKVKPSALGAECRLVKHELGESCVPIQPKRVIVTEQLALEVVLALGIKPIAAPESTFVANKANFLGNKIAGINYIGKENQLNIEAIVKLHPDLIVSLYGINPETYKLFSQIAPTVKVKYSQSGWKDSLQQMGDILNKSDIAKKLLTQYQEKLTNLRFLLGDKVNKIKVSVSRFHGQIQLPEFRSQYSFPGSILAELGISMPVYQRQLIKSPDDNLIILSLERIDLLDADILFVAVDPGAKELFHKYQNSQLWQTLNVVKNQQVYNVDSSYWIFGNILSANAIIDDLFKYLTYQT